ncbi:AIP3-domain-containing protein [Coprinellus micaceus]|uniref:AIP3-domain-containing protein n=1 Tax=Coprinellus micaceus TaxID=71717 RepID=A0A4Y7S5K1_COPMI|nr:AIP3-domain-containing protein [Coprinellus micaceus]
MSGRGHNTGHPSRRDNYSISSSTSAGSSRTERANSSRSNPAVESAVTRLLVSIKALLESLTPMEPATRNDFNEAVAAFAGFNIDMAELVTVPEDLRAVLEQCLAEEATQENLDIYLPEVRQIITNLLQGLRAKQSIYRRIGGERTRPRSKRSDSRTVTEEERHETTGRRSTASSNRGSTRREVSSQVATVSHPNQEPFIGGFAPTIAEYHPGTEAQTVPEPRSLPPAPGSRLSPAPPAPSQLPFPVSNAYSLVDKPAPTPSVTKNDVLERRASKRFSMYNITKITGASTSRAPSLRNHPNRRSLASNNLAVLTEEADEESEQPSRSAAPSRVASPNQSRIRPTTPARSRAPPSVPRDGRYNCVPTAWTRSEEGYNWPPQSFASLRVLFVDKFSYNPGQDNFPAIYIRDPSSGVQYELEDVEEVKDKCLLSLNIEALDQIKQHIDSQISALSQDIKDLKNVVASSQKNNLPALSPMIPDITLQPLAESTPARPSDRQFQTVARRLSRFVGKDPSTIAHMVTQQNSPPMPQILPQQTGQSYLTQQMTGASVVRTQFDEVQNLRRDLATMRQIYTGFMKQTKETLGTLRTQTQSVKQLASTSVGGAQLDSRSQEVLTKVENLQDAVERVKDDVVKRNTTPKPQYFDMAATELESLKEHIKTVKPMWKKTWEEELQNIVEEQQFLTHQEEFLGVLEIYGHMEKIHFVGKRTFRPPPPEEGHNGLSTVMLEIRGAQVDPERRLKAIEESQRNRELEKSMRSDDMQLELQDFVGQKKLKMTGGAEEVERMRQRKR